NEPGHPIKHQFTSNIPTAQCMTCHMHPGTNMVATYLGETWWDNETDGKMLYPQDKQIEPSQSAELEKLDKNPEAASLRGLWSDPNFLELTGTTESNAKLTNVQFADSNGHGWIFKNVLKKERNGNLINVGGRVVAPTDTKNRDKAGSRNGIHT